MPKNTPLFNTKGQRKYLTQEERDRFLDAAYDAPSERRSLCLVLANTGCQLTEALNLTAADIDLSGEAILLGETGRDRRGVPVVSEVIQALDMIHGIKRCQQHADKAQIKRLWAVDRSTANRWINDIMKRAQLSGPAASIRGLRYGFAVQCAQEGVPLDTLQIWMGYTTKKMTGIYASLYGTQSH